MKKRWYDYLWIASLLYLTLGFFNILFAWELLYKGRFTLPTTLHRLTVHLWQSDNQQRERSRICNGAWRGGRWPCPILFGFSTNGKLSDCCTNMFI